MSEKDPLLQAVTSVETSEPTPVEFDWEAKRAELMQQLSEANDPRSILEYLLAFPREHMETEHWDDYLTWVYEQTDLLLSFTKRGIPDVGDEVVMLLADTHAFLEERGDVFPEFKHHEHADEIRQKVLSFVKENLYDFRVDENPPPYRLGLRLPMLSKIVWMCGDEIKDMLLRFMAHHIAIQAIKEGFTDEDYKEENAFAHSDIGFDIDVVCSDLILDEEIEDVAHAVATRTQTKFDLRTQRLNDATLPEKRRAHHKHLREWVASVLALEGHARGSAKLLQDRFGIINFNHYPIEALKRQYDLRDADVPYGVLVGAQYDWNDALVNNFSNEQMLRAFNRNIEEHGSHLRIIEVRTVRDLARHLINLHNAYGQKHKISFAFVRAHGGEEEIQLGNKYGETLSKKNVTGVDAESVKRFFIPKPNVFFDSCSVGAYDGLAEALYEILGGTVQGADEISQGIESIEIGGHGEELMFTITLRNNRKLNTYGETS